MVNSKGKLREDGPPKRVRIVWTAGWVEPGDKGILSSYQQLLTLWRKDLLRQKCSAFIITQPYASVRFGEGLKKHNTKLQSNRYNQYYSVLGIQHNPSVANRVKKYSLNHNKFTLKSEFVFCLEIVCISTV